MVIEDHHDQGVGTDQGATEGSLRTLDPEPSEEPPAKQARISTEATPAAPQPSASCSSGTPTLALRPSKPLDTPNDTAPIKLVVAFSEDKGMKVSQEDVAVMQMDARHPDHVNVDLPIRCCFMAVLDGHGGRQVADLVAEQLHINAQRAGLLQVISDAANTGGQSRQVDVRAAKAAISKGYSTTDSAVLSKCSSLGWVDGACAVAVWIVGCTVLVSNVGDAKAVLARITDKDVGAIQAGTARALILSKDHLAVYPAERARIEKAGGFVSADGRLNGRMQVSRSFGDAGLKSAGCVSTPDITAFELSPRDRFMLLACDGFFSVFDPQDAVNMTTQLLAEGRDVKAVTNRLLNEAVRERKCKDNCTIMLINFVAQSTTP